MSKPSLHVVLRHQAGPLQLDVTFNVNEGWTALFAPSGAGKTTILRLIAGLDRPAEGRIVFGSDDFLLDTATGISIPAHLRQVRMVAQKSTLFPHLNVLENIRYGCTEPGTLEDILMLCRVAHLRAKHPQQLSGGERQRVALARTLAAAPCRLLLLDEPFTGLEADLRDELIHDLHAWTANRDIPVLLVTHDLGEVFAAKAHVLKMDSARITASGPANEVLAEERNRLIQRLDG